MLIKKDVLKFIKTDCQIAIGSEGFIGDKLLVISQGSTDAPLAKDGQELESNEPVETDAIIESLNITAGNIEVITDQLAEIMIKINSGNGTLGRLIEDSTLAENLNKTIVNLKQSSKSLDENMTAVKHNFLLKGYFDRKARKAASIKEKAKKEAVKK
jgi:phospholipid/cholesterol/gamma-HCH transport system substrate-binding protein